MSVLPKLSITDILVVGAAIFFAPKVLETLDRLSGAPASGGGWPLPGAAGYPVAQVTELHTDSPFYQGQRVTFTGKVAYTGPQAMLQVGIRMASANPLCGLGVRNSAWPGEFLGAIAAPASQGTIYLDFSASGLSPITVPLRQVNAYWFIQNLSNGAKIAEGTSCSIIFP